MSEPSRFRAALRWLFTPYGVTQRRAMLVGLLLLALVVLGLMGALR
ncbi:hypothetical protein [Devosia sp.]|nr:hypothetical protein [Devosia sp.]